MNNRYVLAGLWLWIGAALTVDAADLPRIAVSGQRRFVTVRNLSSFYGLERNTLAGGTIRLKNRYTWIDLEPNSRKVSVNGISVWMNAPLSRVWRTWGVTETDLTRVVDPLLRPERYLDQRGHLRVVLDPGHGGPDVGARGPQGSEEKRLVLDLAQRTRTELAQQGYRVSLTRDTDRFIELSDRCRLAAEWGADLFVSIHLNSGGNAQARGPETYVLTAPGYTSTVEGNGGEVKTDRYAGNGFDGSSFVLAYHVQKQLVRQLGAADRGVRHARFVVLREATCPAILVECGFLTCPEEEQRFQQETHREEVARALATGIADYAAEVLRAQAAATAAEP